MQLVRAGFGDDVDHSAARSAQFSRIVAAVDLKLLYSILAQRETHSTRVIIRFPTVHRDAIASAIAAVERKAALGCLLDSKILVGGQPRRIRDTRRQQSEGKIIATADGQVVEVFFRERIRLTASLGLHHRQLGTHFNSS